MTPTPFINTTTFPAAKFANIGTILNLVLPLLMVGAVLIFFVMIVRAGLTILMGAGKPDEIAKATKTIIAAIFGLFLVIGSYIIVKLIGIIFKVEMPL